MPIFQLTLAHDVSVYGNVEVEAENYAAAVEAARADIGESQQFWNDVTSIDWSTCYRFRVVDVYAIDDDGMSQVPLIRDIPLSVTDESDPLTSEQVLTSITAARLAT